MIKNIIFDIGNVLCDFRWREFLLDKGYDEEMADRIGRASVLTPIWYEFDRGGWTYEKILQGFIQNDPEIEKEIREAFADIAGMVTPRDYTIPWIVELKSKGYHVYYLSNYSHKAEVECASALEFIPYTDGGILSYAEKVVKPNPEIYQILMERYGLKADECVFLDDSLPNVEGAKAVGMHAIWFQTKEQAEAELKTMVGK